MVRNEDYGIDWSWHDAHGFSRMVNVAGTMTAVGGSVTSRAVADATAAAMTRFVKIHELQTRAATVIGDLTGAEAGFVTASASAGITLAIAGCLTGLDPAGVEALPTDPGPAPGVAVQMGHLCEYGAPVVQAITLAGARPHVFGQSTLTRDYQLDAALDGASAALYVVSHHVVDYGMMPLETFTRICHAKGVPVIVDAASEYDLTGMIAKGADLVIYSGHKFMGGPTSGIVAGRKDLVRAAYMHNIGIGRGMKIGKESLCGAIAAMEQWKTRDHAAIRAAETRTLDMWAMAVEGLPGITARALPDPTANPLERLRIWIDREQAGASAAQFSVLFGQLDPPIAVRGHEAEKGYIDLDPCNLIEGQAEMVRDALPLVLGQAGTAAQVEDATALSDIRNGGTQSYLDWLG
ncbi:aminotransferase class V-fold PLP-dependent enzyme [Rhodobacteraceae bacterium]|nr:aminotransferase class V-fold PLP-dependent enzyme [Paracoccaceae bacterium]